MMIDAHLDLAFNAVGMGNDLRLPLDQLRQTGPGQHAAARGETLTVSLPELRAADARVVFGTIFVQPDAARFDLTGPCYRTPDEAHVQGLAQVRYYHERATHGDLALIQHQDDLAVALNGSGHSPGVVLLMEGADPIRDPDDVAAWYAAGVRLVGLAWGATRYSGGTHAPGPLTPAGCALLPALAQHKIALDLSHMAEASFWQALDLFDGPILASHANCRAFVPTDRHLSDDMIRAVVERDGVIGVVPYNAFLTPEWTRGQGKTVPLAALVRHIEHICEIAGDTQHVGIGSDMDGGFGTESLPLELHTYADLLCVGDALRVAGWPPGAVANVLSDNWARWLRRALPD